MSKEFCDVFVGCRITKSMKDELETFAESEMISLSDIVRRGLIMELERQKKIG